MAVYHCDKLKTSQFKRFGGVSLDKFHVPVVEGTIVWSGSGSQCQVQD